ncbi:MAG: M61 family metallopeptidase [Acidobacteriota bacterium]
MTRHDRQAVWMGALSLAASVMIGGSLPRAEQGTVPIRLDVDAQDAPRKVFHSHMVLPVRPGPLTLLYPKYIPGEHGPTGPIVNVTGLTFHVGDTNLSWHRDLVDMYTFHLEIPDGATLLDISLDFLSPVDNGQFTGGVSATPTLMALNWNQVLLYPAGRAAREILYEPRLHLPAGWKFGTALPVAASHGGQIRFRPVPLNTLVDSPVIAGRYFREVDISTGEEGPRHFIDMVSDNPAALEMSEADITHHRNLVREAGALFAAHHYDSYRFLLTLSELTAHFGLEHHESSDDRTGERLFLDPKAKLIGSGLLPHEFVHSWNGKFRRPADLTTPDYQTPMKTDLLWVYEGLTTYLGQILTARSGLWSATDFRGYLAYTAATMDHRPGRTWRPLSDTTAAAQILYGAPSAWESWRRRPDFYPEGLLIWLEVDTTIRRLTHDRKSIDDFTRLFHGVHPGRIRVQPYTFDDLAATLQQVAPFDWGTFLRDRLESRRPGAPLQGLKASGWKLAYTSEPSGYIEAYEEVRKQVDLTFSIGLLVTEKGEIRDVLWGGPAHQAGLGAGMTLVAVNGRKFDPHLLRQAVAATRDSRQPLELLVENQEFYTTHSIDYHDGLRYPHLERIASRPDGLGAIIAPRAAPDR